MISNRKYGPSLFYKKIKTSLVLIPLIATIPFNAAIANEDIKTLSPTGDWRVKQYANHCALNRTFGTGKDEVKFNIDIRQNFFAQNAKLTGVSIPRLPKKPAITIIQNGKKTETKANFFLLKERPQNGVRWLGTILRPNMVDKDQSLDILINNKSQYRLALGTSRDVITSAAKCQKALLEAWGYDYEKSQKIAVLPEPNNNPLKEISFSDFPSVTRAGFKRELLTFKVEVDENGLGGPCSIVAPSKITEIDRAICRLVDQNQQYKPAKTKDGNTTAATYIKSVNWTISRSGFSVFLF